MFVLVYKWVEWNRLFFLSASLSCLCHFRELRLEKPNKQTKKKVSSNMCDGHVSLPHSVTTMSCGFYINLLFPSYIFCFHLKACQFIFSHCESCTYIITHPLARLSTLHYSHSRCRSHFLKKTNLHTREF